MIIRLISLIIALSLPLASCGYSLVGRGSSLPSNLQSVSIPMFENKTGEPNLDTVVTRIVKEQFIKDGRLKVESESAADTILKGTIVSYTLKPLAYDEQNNVTEYMVRLTVSVVHSWRNTGKILQKQVINTNWRYLVDPAITVAESLRLDATEKAAVNAAESIVSLVIEAF